MTRDDFLDQTASRIHDLINRQVRSPTLAEIRAAIKSNFDQWVIAESAAQQSMNKPADMGIFFDGDPSYGTPTPLGKVVADTLNKWCEEVVEEEEVQGPPQGGWKLESLEAFFEGYITERMELAGFRLVTRERKLECDAQAWVFYSYRIDQGCIIELSALETMQNKTLAGMMDLGAAKFAQAIAPYYLSC